MMTVTGFDDPRNIENPYGLRRSWQMEEGEGHLDSEMEFLWESSLTVDNQRFPKTNFD